MRTVGLALIALILVACSASASGAGTVEFGTQLDRSTNTLLDGRTTFSAGDTFALVAHLSEPAGVATLQMVYVRKEGNAETPVFTADVDVAQSASDTTLGFSGVDFSTFVAPGLGQPGTYLVRLVRDSTVLAEGQFEYQ